MFQNINYRQNPKSIVNIDNNTNKINININIKKSTLNQKKTINNKFSIKPYIYKCLLKLYNLKMLHSLLLIIILLIFSIITFIIFL